MTATRTSPTSTTVAEVDDEGVEEAFELEADISEVVQTGKWIGDCFVCTNGANRLNYVVGGQTHNHHSL